jgi:hypothetical protein
MPPLHQPMPVKDKCHFFLGKKNVICTKFKTLDYGTTYIKGLYF